MPPRENEPVGTNERNDEVHPAFALIGASRVSTGPPGATLFQSDVRHSNTIRIKIQRATRKRDLNNDYVHGANNVVEVELSESQWASFVSSMNIGDGVPCTMRWTEKDGQMSGLDYSPRLALSMGEVHSAADKAFAGILDALAKLEAVEAKEKPTAKERREALAWLKSVIKNATPNVDFAGSQLSKHAEAVVNRARADIEAVVLAKAKQLKLEAGDIAGLYELSGPTVGRCDACGHQPHGAVCFNAQSDNDCDCTNSVPVISA